MADYEKMYRILFNAITDALDILSKAQIAVEEIYIKEKCKNIEFKRKQ